MMSRSLFRCKDAQITALESRLNMCAMQGIADGAVASAVNQIRPIVPNPYANYNYGFPNWNTCNCGNNNFGVA